MQSKNDMPHKPQKTDAIYRFLSMLKSGHFWFSMIAGFPPLQLYLYSIHSRKVRDCLNGLNSFIIVLRLENVQEK